MFRILCAPQFRQLLLSSVKPSITTNLFLARNIRTSPALCEGFQLVKNNKIPYPTVHVLDPETNEPGPLVELKSLLDALEVDKRKLRDGYFYMLVSEDPVPVVKFTSKKDLPVGKRATPSKPKQPETKVFQIKWVTDEKDVELRVKKAREYLLQGDNVIFEITPKGRSAFPAPDEANAVINDLILRLKDVTRKQDVERKGHITRISFVRKK